MSILDRIKFNGLESRNWLVYRHPKEDLVIGSSLIVGEGQMVVLAKDGRICDEFYPGMHILSTKNIPIFKSIVNIPYGGETPFAAEVYFINTTTKMDMHWGTTDPIQVIDPKYFIRLHIRAFGQFGIKIVDCRKFICELIGAMGSSIVNYDNVMDFYKGVLTTKIKTIISDVIINQKISALEITPKLEEISAIAFERVSRDFGEYGLNVTNFFIQSINFPDEDFEQISKLLEDLAAFEIMGDNRYATKRSFDVYEGAANNEGGVAGAFMSSGLGLGMGMAAAGKFVNGNTVKPLVSSEICCPHCNVFNPTTSNFCSSCGSGLVVSKTNCTECGSELSRGDKFCNECGTIVQKK